YLIASRGTADELPAIVAFNMKVPFDPAGITSGGMSEKSVFASGVVGGEVEVDPSLAESVALETTAGWLKVIVTPLTVTGLPLASVFVTSKVPPSTLSPGPPVLFAGIVTVTAPPCSGVAVAVGVADGDGVTL